MEQQLKNIIQKLKKYISKNFFIDKNLTLILTLTLILLIITIEIKTVLIFSAGFLTSKLLTKLKNKEE